MGEEKAIKPEQIFPQWKREEDSGDEIKPEPLVSKWMSGFVGGIFFVFLCIVFADEDDIPSLIAVFFAVIAVIAPFLKREKKKKEKENRKIL